MSYSKAKRCARLTLSQSYPPLSGDQKRKPAPIPVRLGLLTESGKELALKIDGKPLGAGFVMLRKRKEAFTFEDVPARPVLSILRDFSAPVNLRAGASDRDMLALMRCDSDLFNRWQTAQAFALKHIAGMAAAIAGGGAPRVNPRFVSAMGDVAADRGLEHAYRAAFLAVPSEVDVAQAIGLNVDPEAIHAARLALRAAMGRSLRTILEDVYEESAPAEPYSPEAESAGRRALRQASLSLLAAAKSRFGIAKVKEQASAATNMTESMGALSILSQMGGAAYDQALQRFHRRWKDEPLVMNKWFALQAVSPSPDTLRRIKELTAHPLFSTRNPNRVRSVYGAFAHNNQVRFNDLSGEGYDLIASAVIEIDGFNPQVASRLVSAFESWRIFEPRRRALAANALRRVLAKNDLSSDVFEIASKLIGDAASAKAA